MPPNDLDPMTLAVTCGTDTVRSGTDILLVLFVFPAGVSHWRSWKDQFNLQNLWFPLKRLAGLWNHSSLAVAWVATATDSKWGRRAPPCDKNSGLRWAFPPPKWYGPLAILLCTLERTSRIMNSYTLTLGVQAPVSLRTSKDSTRCHCRHCRTRGQTRSQGSGHSLLHRVGQWSNACIMLKRGLFTKDLSIIIEI